MKLLALLGSLSAWAVLLQPAIAAAPGAGARPNIIFVLTDDLGYGDVGVFFQNLRKTKNERDEPWHLTPRLDEIAAQGIQLRGHYCPAPVCAPSRASLLSGLHQGHANVRDNQFDKALAENHTIGTVLDAAGYKTAALGKWGLQGPGKDPASWPAYPTKRGFGYYYGYVRHKDGHEHYPKEGPYKGPQEVWDQEREVSAELDKCYTADLFTARAKKWIVDQQAAHAEQPFFLYLAYDTPHATTELPTQAYPAGGGLQGGLQWTGTPGSMINTASGTIDSYYHPDYVDAKWDHDGDFATPEQPWPDVYKRYATSVRRIDDAVGDLVQTLKDLKIDDNTLLVFTTDNGPSNESYLSQRFGPEFFNSFGPFDGIKRDLWEGGIRVGAIARWPAAIPAGRVSTAPSQFHDWLPTFAELAGVTPPAKADGVSLLPTLSGQGEQKASTVYVEYFQPGKTPQLPEIQVEKRGRARNQMQAIRLGDFMGVRSDIKDAAQDFEIYDVEKDPQELVNLATSRGDLQRQMKEAVLRLRRPDPAAKRPYDEELVPAVEAPAVKPGVQWKSYERPVLNTPTLPRWELLPHKAQGWAPRPFAYSMPKHAPTLAAPKDEHGLLFTGYLRAPADGKYTLYLEVKGRALLRVHEATVIDADYNYEGEERSGDIWLRAGLHPFRLYYAAIGKETRGVSFTFKWSRDGAEKGQIPEENFFCAGDGTATQQGKGESR